MKAEHINDEFLELVNRYQPVIHRVCRMYADSPEDRRDLFQETLYQLWRSYPSFKGWSNFSTWVYRIALNTAITALRREKKRPYNVEFQDDMQQVPAPSGALDDAQRTGRLYRAIRSLNDVERALVMLYLDELSYKEMADVLGLSESNVGVKLNRIKAKLQHILKGMK